MPDGQSERRPRETLTWDALLDRIRQSWTQPPPKDLDHAAWTLADFDLAMELHRHLTEDPDRLIEIDDDAELDLPGWLLDLPGELAAYGFVDEAVQVCDRFAEVLEADNFLGDKAVILAEAGRQAQAVAQVTHNLLEFPEDAWVCIKAGDAYQRLSDEAQAEAFFRRGLELAGQDRYTRAGALERLLPLLERTGRIAGAEALGQAQPGLENVAADDLDLLAGELDEEPAEGWLPDPYVRPDPKVGRNDPCPCGSGKKYKKCCLGTGSA